MAPSDACWDGGTEEEGGGLDDCCCSASGSGEGEAAWGGVDGGNSFAKRAALRLAERGVLAEKQVGVGEGEGQGEVGCAWLNEAEFLMGFR